MQHGESYVLSEGAGDCIITEDMEREFWLFCARESGTTAQHFGTAESKTGRGKDGGHDLDIVYIGEKRKGITRNYISRKY
jgi:hypothetical protein